MALTEVRRFLGHEPTSEVSNSQWVSVYVCIPFHPTKGEQGVKPPLSSSGLTSAGSGSCRRCLAEAGADRKRSLGGGKDSGGVSDMAVVQYHHTCCRTSPQQLDVPASLTPHGPGPYSFDQQQKRGASTSGMELGQELVVGDLATPLTSAGAGDVGAEHDATPLQSRPSRGGGFALSSVPGGDAGGDGTEGAVENPSTSETEDNSGVGRGGLERKDTITWESFLATITDADGIKGADGSAIVTALGSASDSPSPVEVQSPRDGCSEGIMVEVSLFCKVSIFVPCRLCFIVSL